jgi:hypothetical protein
VGLEQRKHWEESLSDGFPGHLWLLGGGGVTQAGMRPGTSQASTVQNHWTQGVPCLQGEQREFQSLNFSEF